MARVRVEVESEAAFPDRPARVLVFEDDQLVVEVVALIKFQKGADGGYYRYVSLEKIERVLPEKPHTKTRYHGEGATLNGPAPH